MASPAIDALDRQVNEMHSRATEFRGSISSEVEEYRRRLTHQADDLDAEIKRLEETRDKLLAAEAAVEMLPQQ